jgi:hypothetical protein
MNNDQRIMILEGFGKVSIAVVGVCSNELEDSF